MRKSISILLTGLFLLALSCKVNETPEIIRIENVLIEKYTVKDVTLKSDILFHNPNIVGGVLRVNQLKVIVNEINMGFVNSSDFKVPAQKDFSVPVVFTFPFKRVYQDQEGLLKGVINTLTNKKLDVQYKGIITYKLKQFSYDYPVDYSETIELKRQ